MPEGPRISAEMAGGLWIRRVWSPAVMGSRRLVRASPESNKENTPVRRPAGSATWRRLARKSPLPEWYPRTPLKDITAIVLAMDRRRHREQAEQANREREAAPRTTPPSLEEQNVFDHQSTTPSPTFASLLSPTEHPLQMSSASSSDAPTPKHKQLPVNEEKLCSSIDQMEKIVKRNLKKVTKKEPAARMAAQRKTLMSMR